MLLYLDLATFHALHALAGLHPWLDAAIVTFTNGAPLPFALLLARYFLWPGTGGRRMRRTVLLAGVSGVLAVAISLVAGEFIYSARPFAMLPPEQLYVLVPRTPDSSFPSDHAMGAGAFAVGMWWAGGRARWIFLCTALLAALSRVVVGVHWPSDVLLSLLAGAGVALAVHWLTRPAWPWLDRLLAWAERWLPRHRLRT